MAEKPEKSCFVVCPIGARGSETRDRMEGIFNEVIAPVTEEFGYRADIAIHDKSPGIITERIVMPSPITTASTILSTDTLPRPTSVPTTKCKTRLTWKSSCFRARGAQCNETRVLSLARPTHSSDIQ